MLQKITAPKGIYNLDCSIINSLIKWCNKALLKRFCVNKSQFHTQDESIFLDRTPNKLPDNATAFLFKHKDFYN